MVRKELNITEITHAIIEKMKSSSGEKDSNVVQVSWNELDSWSDGLIKGSDIINANVRDLINLIEELIQKPNFDEETKDLCKKLHFIATDILTV